ncbi:MAG: PHP domain-containing protein [Saprospiraceae bacterium]
MITNKELAGQFDLMGKLMELHGENSFRTKTYTLAYLSLKKVEVPFCELTENAIADIPNVGTNNAIKIKTALNTGILEGLQPLLDKTPPGVIDMLKIKGLGPKKVGQIWKELQIEDLGQLQYACQENRLVHLNGFGIKIQKDISEKINFLLSQKGKFLFASVIDIAEKLIEELQQKFPLWKWELTNEIRRKNQVITSIDILTDSDQWSSQILECSEIITENDFLLVQNIPVKIHFALSKHFDYSQFIHTEGILLTEENDKNISKLATEAEIFKALHCHYIPPEARDNFNTKVLFDINKEIPQLVKLEDIKGIVHCHTTYSDGLHSLADMAAYTASNGFEYMVVTDHSKSATYAHGLTIEKVLSQWAEIDSLNESYSSGFRIIKGIESDILSDGNLDYDSDILKGFDIVIASIHSGLQMDENKATSRLIKAIENPHTTILGHPTGRLLLSRSGYPVNFDMVIDACRQNCVAIEINANPQRLDLDWTFISKCID